MKSLLALTLPMVLLIGCSGAETTQSDANSKTSPSETVAPIEVTTVSWEDLMPEGEDERLETLYTEFYSNLEQQYKNDQTTLMGSQEYNALLSSIPDGSANDTMEQIGTFNVVSDLDGQAIRIPGYIVPLNFSQSSEYDEFLLVPYFGACLHTPPPPPNQMVFVRAKPAAKVASIDEPVWLEGTLKTGEFLSELGDSAYEMNLSKIEAYEF